jgi:hypothetical protein
MCISTTVEIESSVHRRLLPLPRGSELWYIHSIHPAFHFRRFLPTYKCFALCLLHSVRSYLFLSVLLSIFSVFRFTKQALRFTSPTFFAPLNYARHRIIPVRRHPSAATNPPHFMPSLQHYQTATMEKLRSTRNWLRTRLTSKSRQNSDTSEFRKISIVSVIVPSSLPSSPTSFQLSPPSLSRPFSPPYLTFHLPPFTLLLIAHPPPNTTTGLTHELPPLPLNIWLGHTRQRDDHRASAQGCGEYASGTRKNTLQRQHYEGTCEKDLWGGWGWGLEGKGAFGG